MSQQYDKAVQSVLDYLVEQGFSQTPCEDFRRTSREFSRYLQAESLEYSPSVAQVWLEALKPSLPKWKFVSFRRSLALVEDAARNGSVTKGVFSYDRRVGKRRAPECFKQLLDAYLQRRRQDGNQLSTLHMDRNACMRFLLFLQTKKITDVACITPEIVKEYQSQDEHRTTEGKNAYICRIRGFVRFLATKKLVPQTLELAFATEKASSVSIVTTLSKEQVNSIRAFAERSRSPSQLRSAAMTMLALDMGLRCVDICNLRLSDICWKSGTISFVQQKTGQPLTLPFPVEVGNLLARYILEGRPECDLPNVFITLKHPHTPLKTAARCYSASLSVLGKKTTPEDVRGLHVIRRTFASNLLAAGNPVSLISCALGHTSDSAVDEYLATDEQNMRRCAIGLSGIEVGEALV
jgi:site-specific recombinase XerD